MNVGEEEKQAIWYPSKGDWEAIVSEMKGDGTVPSRVLKVSEEEFKKRLYVEMMNGQLFQQMSTTVEAAWALGLLVEVQRGDKSACSAIKGFYNREARGSA